MEGLSIDQPKAIKSTGKKEGFLSFCAKQRILNLLHPGYQTATGYLSTVLFFLSGCMWMSFKETHLF